VLPYGEMYHKKRTAALEASRGHQQHQASDRGNRRKHPAIGSDILPFRILRVRFAAASEDFESLRPCASVYKQVEKTSWVLAAPWVWSLV
jgi:hypothetical protein